MIRNQNLSYRLGKELNNYVKLDYRDYSSDNSNISDFKKKIMRRWGL